MDLVECTWKTACSAAALKYKVNQKPGLVEIQNARAGKEKDRNNHLDTFLKK